MATEREYRATVEKIIPKGEHGPYMVTRSDGLGVVTLSLNQKCWKEKDWPETGTEVLLAGVFKKRQGWRAKSVRTVTPSDNSNQQ